MNITINPYLVNTKSCNKPKAFGNYTLDILNKGLSENGQRVAEAVANTDIFQEISKKYNTFMTGKNNSIIIKVGRKVLREPLGKSVNLPDIPKYAAEIAAKLENVVKIKKK